jgi:hypothetical protein
MIFRERSQTGTTHPSEGGMSATWAYIFHAPEADPAKDRFVIDRGGVRAILVAVPNHAAATSVASELVKKEGAVSIEVCGYFGPLEAAKIHGALEGKVPVGPVMFGAESVLGVVKAFFPHVLKS